MVEEKVPEWAKNMALQLDSIKMDQAHMNVRFDRLEKKIDRTKSELEAKIDRTKSELEAKIDRTKSELEAKIDRTKSELEAKINRARNEFTKEIRASEGRTRARASADRKVMEAVIMRVSADMRSGFARNNEQMVRMSRSINNNTQRTHHQYNENKKRIEHLTQDMKCVKGALLSSQQGETQKRKRASPVIRRNKR